MVSEERLCSEGAQSERRMFRTISLYRRAKYEAGENINIFNGDENLERINYVFGAKSCI